MDMAHAQLPRRNTLNIDILLVVASFCDLDTLAQIIQSCKAAYHPAARYALDSEDGVRLSSNRAITLFLRFMRPDNGKRWTYLMGLDIWMTTRLQPKIAIALASAVRKATNLETLKLTRAEEILGSHPDLGPALASLPRVKHLSISEAHMQTLKMLEEMRWPLETASLRRTRFNDLLYVSDVETSERIHPVQLLKNARHTLKSVTLDSWREYLERPPECPVYPHMTSLTVSGNHCPLTVAWAVSYPNLAHLEVSTIERDFFDDADDSLEIYLETRESNRQAHLARGAWKELDTFSGGPIDLYLVGAPCRIRRLELDLSSDELRFLPTVFADARPAALGLSLKSNMFERCGSSWLLDHLRDPALSDLRALSISVSIYLPRTELAFPTFLDALAAAVPLLRLRSLALSVQLEKMDMCYDSCSASGSASDLDDEDEDDAGEAPRPRKERAPPPLCATELYMRDVEVDEVARRFLQASECLESVEVDIKFWEDSGYQDKHTRATRAEILAT